MGSRRALCIWLAIILQLSIAFGYGLVSEIKLLPLILLFVDTLFLVCHFLLYRFFVTFQQDCPASLACGARAAKVPLWCGPVPDEAGKCGRFPCAPDGFFGQAFEFNGMFWPVAFPAARLWQAVPVAPARGSGRWSRGRVVCCKLGYAMKYLLLFGLVAVIWWVWSKRKASADAPHGRPTSPASEKMVSCAHCGVYLPESDSVSDGGQLYCCEAHRVLGSSADRR